MKIDGLKCDNCGDEELFSVMAGTEGRKSDMFRLTPSYPDRGWCWDCWVGKFGDLMVDQVKRLVEESAPELTAEPQPDGSIVIRAHSALRIPRRKGRPARSKNGGQQPEQPASTP